jgi:MbtH protein
VTDQGYAQCFRVLVNEEGQYSLYPEALPIPEGWRGTDIKGAQDHCFSWVEENWTDMRPLSQRGHIEDH